MSLGIKTKINQTKCGCDGAIAIVGSGGYPPYSYSINMGQSYYGFPLFTNLCEGYYTVSVRDISGQTASQLVTINKPSKPTTYIVSLQTTEQIIQNNINFVTKQNVTTLNITPTLPNDVYITFDITHTNTITSSPNNTSATGISSTNLYINSSAITLSNSATTTASTVNSTPGCQNQNKYSTILSEDWKTLSYSGGNDFEIITTNTLYKNEDVNCYIGEIQSIYSINNIKIFGCNCCNITSS